MAKKNETAVVKREEILPLMAQGFEEDAQGGFGNADSQSYALPYLTILQKGSPQCDEDHGAYVVGAKPGMLFNNVTEKAYDGEAGVLVVPVEFLRTFVEWVPRDQGGGFRGMHAVDSDVVTNARPGESGKLIATSGNYLSDTRYHFCLLLDGASVESVVISMSSTQTRKSRNWMTQLRTEKFTGSKGGLFTPPTYAFVYRLTTVAEQNDRGSWRGWKVVKERVLDLSTQQDALTYTAAKELQTQVSAGTAKVAAPEETTAVQSDF